MDAKAGAESLLEGRRLDGADLWEVLTEKPWIAVIAAAGFGLLLGISVSCIRKCRRRGSRAGPPGDDRPWESVRLWHRCCLAGTQCKAAGLNAFFYQLLMTRTCVVTAIAIAILAVSVSTFATGIMLRIRLDDMQANMMGDPEKKYVDECMRDFEGLSTEDKSYQDEYKLCMEKLVGTEPFRWLPLIRLTVDERVCEPASLCDGAPGECFDTSDRLSADFRPGTVSSCYDLIGRSKAERDHKLRAEQQAEVETRCTGSSAWADYSKKAFIKYCMWKHVNVGLCMNSMRTNCPEDDSCCPVAENARGGGADRVVRPSQYSCQKSPTDGLYCQQVDYRVPGPGNASDRALCTDVTCDAFAWCRDVSDIPGICAGEACQAYQRSLDLSIVIILLMAFASLLDITYIVLLIRFPTPKLKGFSNAVGGCLKLLAYGFFVAGGIDDFVLTAVAHSCFNAEGNARVVHAKDFAATFHLLVLITMAGSLVVAPVSVHWGSQLVGLPYTRGRYAHQSGRQA